MSYNGREFEKEMREFASNENRMCPYKTNELKFIFKKKTEALRAAQFSMKCCIYMGGKAHKVAVLSADVDKKEKSVGCHRPEMTLSLCWATTTDGNGIVRSPCRSVSTNLLS